VKGFAGVIAGVIVIAMVAVVAMVAGAVVSPIDRSRWSAAGFKLSPPDVAKCQTQAKLLADTMASVTETVKCDRLHGDESMSLEAFVGEGAVQRA
jgi:hypothetical protein